ncbi:hypothetical protein [Paraburkholderia phosphatilytica]|uniref:hypothetical protein n=1 Tax=Paraburkholderia phosphatilytica TaxID=2282883 RepID=UPI000F603B0A|nr:hypothetical protein [Paraburkholderia phosphatilytica]
MDRKTLTCSEMIKALEHMIATHGDRPVYFTDGFFRYGVNCHPESAPNFDSSKAFLVKAFNLETGRNGPNEPLKF